MRNCRHARDDRRGVEGLPTAEPPHTGKLATVRKDGRPHVAPIWFDLDDDGSIVFTTGAESLKGRSIRRDPRVCLYIDDERPRSPS